MFGRCLIDCIYMIAIRSKLVYFVYDPRAESGDSYDVYDSGGGTARRQRDTTYTTVR